MSNELYHHGILGQKWGIRRFQKTNGTLTTAGKNRYKPTKTDEKNLVNAALNVSLIGEIRGWIVQPLLRKKQALLL